MYSTAYSQVVRFKLSNAFFISLSSFFNHATVVFLNDILLPHAGTTAHALELAGKLGVVLLDLDLCPRGLGVGEGVDEFALGTGKLSGALKELEGLNDLALLEEELGHGGNGDVALGVNWESVMLAHKL